MLVRNTLEHAGFMGHPTKCNWEPTQHLVWLGFVIDLSLGQIEVPLEKIASLKAALTQTRAASYVQARRLASIIGQVIYMGSSIGSVSRFMTQSLLLFWRVGMQARCDQLIISQKHGMRWFFGGTKPNRVQITANLALSLGSEVGFQ